MEASTTIRKMMAGIKIIVPTYQRAYSWDSKLTKSDKNTQTDVFLSDLEDYSRSKSTNPYYFGHFLFEERAKHHFVIDGQQRLTTIVIFLSALFAAIKKYRDLTDDEEQCLEDMVIRKSTVRFSTVDYDNQLFLDYVIKQTKTDSNGIETESSARIVRAFDYFHKEILPEKSVESLTDLLAIVSGATCSTHLVKNESEAIQMFIFQNNRGKKPSDLEIVKAQFMYNVHLYGGEETNALLDEIKNRFEKIYKSIASIEHRLSEDDVLLYTLKVHFNSLWQSNSLGKIREEISKDNSIAFITNFTRSLSASFEHLSSFFKKHERDVFAIHSLVTLGGFSIALPFIIKAYCYGLSLSELSRLCSAIESLVLRHRVIGTRAEITSRINDVFEKFTIQNATIQPILDRIEYMKKVTAKEWWWSYWNNENFDRALQGEVGHGVSKYLLWKYETHLEQQGKAGYNPTRFDHIINPELEHIAPTAEPTQKPHGYDNYDEEFRNKYLNCLGNYLLLSKSHNCSVGNVPFDNKRVTYTHNEQQREISRMASNTGLWTKDLIAQRKSKIVDVILKNC